MNCNLSNPEKNGECGGDGQQEPRARGVRPDLRPELHRPAGASVRTTGASASRSSRKSLPRVSVNVGYFRNWWGNWYTVDNRATDARGLHAVQHHGAGRSAAAGRRRLRRQRPVRPRTRTRSGSVDELATNSNNFAKQIENWQGVDVGVSARLRNGLTMQGGTSTGRKLADACALKAAVPEQGQGARGATTVDRRRGSPATRTAAVVEPYLTSIPGLATYTIPKIGVQVSGTWREQPRGDRSRRTTS